MHITTVLVKKVKELAWSLHLQEGDLLRGSAERHYRKRNALTLELDNHLIAEYIMVIHNASQRSQKAARYLHNISGLAKALTCVKLLASRSFRNVSVDYINVSLTKAYCRVFKKFR